MLPLKLNLCLQNSTKPKLAADVDLKEIGYNNKCDGYTGADLAALIREAGIEALKELMDMHYSGQPEISMRHIVLAFDKIRPSVQEKVNTFVSLIKIKNILLIKIYITRRILNIMKN